MRIGATRGVELARSAWPSRAARTGWQDRRQEEDRNPERLRHLPACQPGVPVPPQQGAVPKGGDSQRSGCHAGSNGRSSQPPGLEVIGEPAGAALGLPGSILTNTG